MRDNNNGLASGVYIYMVQQYTRKYNNPVRSNQRLVTTRGKVACLLFFWSSPSIHSFKKVAAIRFIKYNWFWQHWEELELILYILCFSTHSNSFFFFINLFESTGMTILYYRHYSFLVFRHKCAIILTYDKALTISSLFKLHV